MRTTNKVTAFEMRDALKISHRRENGGERENYNLIVFDAKRKSNYHDGFFTAVDVRIYFSKGETVYACVWINDSKNGVHGSGSDSARGYGYHKGSAAVAGALRACGVDFQDEISGRGDSAITDALHAIAEHLKYKNYTVIKTHA